MAFQRSFLKTGSGRLFTLLRFLFLSLFLCPHFPPVGDKAAREHADQHGSHDNERERHIKIPEKNGHKNRLYILYGNDRNRCDQYYDETGFFMGSATLSNSLRMTALGAIGIKISYP